MSLQEYRRKRDFKKTSEPAGRTEPGGEYHFVIQKHRASHLHYDFRLQIGGTLKSWAVPKGVPYAKGEKRLAVQVEDHPVSYRDFEGTIPAGEYGGGTVMVWDYGTFIPDHADPEKELAGGKLHFTLNGKKLTGTWYLVQLRGSTQWLLIRGGESIAPFSERQDDTSALSGLSMDEIAAGNKPVWKSNRAVKPTPGKKIATIKQVATPAPAIKPVRRGTLAKLKFVPPMQAKLVNAPPPGDWIYEIKFDGFRALALKEGATVNLFSRNKKDFNAKFPDIHEALKKINAGNAIIDGEIVALDSKGKSSFQLLQAYDLGQEKPPLFFYAFDLLQLDGEDLTTKPLGERKARLEQLLKAAPPKIRFSASLTGKVSIMLARAKKLGLEGLIGKRSDSAYESNRRSGAWIKLKLLHEQEFVIGGYSPPAGSRHHFGALLVGVYEQGKLIFTGKVGTGFNDALLKELHQRFQKIAQPECPFINLPETKGGRYSPAITARVMRDYHWLEPSMVAQLKFSEWTRDHKLRQPVFLGLREDKNARDVIRETPQ